MKIQLDCVTWKLELGQLYLRINWIKVNRFSSKQSNHSGFVNICNSRRSPHSLQSSTSCSLCGAWHNEDVRLQTLLSIEGCVLQWLSSFFLHLKRAVGNYLLSQIGLFWISTSIPLCRLLIWIKMLFCLKMWLFFLCQKVVTSASLNYIILLKNLFHLVYSVRT